MKRIMICVDIEKESLEAIKRGFKKLSINSGDSIHLVHCFPIRTYTDLFYVASMPGIEEYGEIEDSVIKILKNLKDEIFSPEDKVEINFECLFSSLVKRELLEYSKNNNIEKIVVFTKERHGLFDSSFAQYLLSNSNCDLDIIRS